MDPNLTLPFLARIPVALPQVPIQEKHLGCCQRRPHKNMQNTFLTIKFTDEKAIFVYDHRIICYIASEQQTLSLYIPRPISFVLANIDLSLVLLVSEVPDTQDSIDYSFTIYRENQLLAKKSYRIKDFAAVEIRENKLFLFKTDSQLEIFAFSPKFEFSKIKTIKILQISFDFQQLFVPPHSEDVFIEFREKNNKNKAKIFHYNFELGSESEINIEIDEKINGIFKSNAKTIILTPQKLILNQDLDSKKINLIDFQIGNWVYSAVKNQFFVISASEIKLLSISKEEFSFQLVDLVKIQKNHPKTIFLSQNNDSFILLADFEKNEEISDFEIIKMRMENPESVLLEAYKEEFYEKAELFLKRFDFDEQTLFKKRWEISTKDDNAIFGILLKMEDFEFLEMEFGKFQKKLKMETLEKFLEKQWDLLVHRFRTLVSHNPREAFEIFRRILENFDKNQTLRIFFKLTEDKNLESSQIDLEKFLEFYQKDRLEIFTSYLLSNKSRSLRIYLETYSQIIFNNYWTIWSHEGILTRSPEKFLIILPRASLKNPLSPQHTLDFNDFFWDLYSKTSKESIFAKIFTENFPEISNEILLKMSILAKNIESTPNFKYFLSQTENLDSLETYREISRTSYYLTGDPQKVLLILEHGLRSGFEALKPEILAYKLLEILSTAPGHEDIEIEDYMSLSEFDRIGRIIEAFAKDNAFVDLINGSIRELYSELSSEREFYRGLKAFSMQKRCSVKIFIELLRLQILGKSTSNPSEFIGLVESFKESRMLCEHYRELQALADLLSLTPSLSNEEYLNDLRRTSDIASILYVFSLNLPISALRSMEFVAVASEILQNAFLNRRKEDRLVLENEIFSLEPVSACTLAKVLLELRNRAFQAITDRTIYQVFVKKLLENSKFSLIRELLGDRLLKRIDPEVFEFLVCENIEGVYRSSTELSHVEYSLKKSLELLPNDSHSKRREKALFDALKILETMGVRGVSLAEARNGNRVEFLRKIIASLKEKIRELNLVEILRLFAEFDGRETGGESDGLLAEFAERLLTDFNELEKAKSILDILLKRGSSLNMDHLTLKLLNTPSLSLSEREKYRKLAILKASTPETILKLLKYKSNDRTSIEYNESEFLLTDRTILEKEATEKVLKPLFQGLFGRTPSLSDFIRDLTINSTRAFFQLTLQETLDIDSLDELSFELLKNDVIKRETLAVGVCIVSGVRCGILDPLSPEKILSFLTKPDTFQISPNDTNNSINNNNKASVFYQKIIGFLQIYRKLPIMKNFLSNQSETKRFLFDPAFRNSRLVTLLMESQEPGVFEAVEPLLRGQNFNLKDLFISRLVKDFSELDRDSAISDYKRLIQLIGNHPVDSLQKVYEKVRFNKAEVWEVFQEVALAEYQLDEKKTLAFGLLNQILNGANEIRGVVPEIKEILSEKSQGRKFEKSPGIKKKNREYRQFYQYIDESNVFLIAKTVGILTSSIEYEEKIYCNFLKKILKGMENYAENEEGKEYDRLVLEMQKTLAVLPRLGNAKKIDKILKVIAKKQNIRNGDLFEVYSNIYTFAEERLRNILPKGAVISEFLSDAGSLIDFKMRCLRHLHKLSPTSRLYPPLSSFRIEPLYEEEPVFDFLDLLLSNPDPILSKIVSPAIFERFLIQKLRFLLLELGDRKGVDEAIKKLIFYGEDTEIRRAFEKCRGFLGKLEGFLDGLGKNLNGPKLWEGVERFLVENIATSEEYSACLKIGFLDTLQKKWGLNNRKLTEAINELKFESFLMETGFTGKKYQKDDCEGLVSFLLEEEVILVNFIQTHEKSLENILLKNEKFLKSKEKLIDLVNLGILDPKSHLPEGFGCIFEDFENIPSKEQILSLLSISSETSQGIIRLILSTGCLVDVLNTEYYVELFDYFLLNTNEDGFYTVEKLEKGRIFENKERFEEFLNGCWFGNSGFNVLIKNLVRFIERNEYYDAAKLNYLNRKRELGTIEEMMKELRRTLEDVERREKEVRLGKRVKNCIEKIKKLNK